MRQLREQTERAVDVAKVSSEDPAPGDELGEELRHLVADDAVVPPALVDDLGDAPRPVAEAEDVAPVGLRRHAVSGPSSTCASAPWSPSRRTGRAGRPVSAGRDASGPLHHAR